jgi:coenzyme F420-0:L-glutamate ligase/coenzyme F420-1:gamma-L-glutamate ligase
VQRIAACEDALMKTRNRSVSLSAVEGLPEIEPGMDLAEVLAAKLRALDPALTDGDVVVVAQKIVSKADSRYVDLCSVSPSPRAAELAVITRKDPRLIEIILGESSEILRAVRDVLIVRHRLGFVMAQAGVDQSNVSDGPNGERALLLPVDPHASATRLRDALGTRLGFRPGLIISDSFGRPWRLGVVNIALGAAGIASLWDRRGEADRSGRALKSTWVAWGDALASAAGLVMGEADEGTPVVVIRGARGILPHSGADALIRPFEQDLFR